MSLLQKISLFFKKKESNVPVNDNGQLMIHNYVGKFVKHNGKDIGESIAFEETRFIVKNPEGFISVPLSAIIKNTETIEIGDFDKEESLQFGKEWFEKKDTLKFDKDGMLILEPQDQ